MKVELREVTRGRGSLYAHVVASADEGEGACDAAMEGIRAAATSPEGNRVPCELYRLEGIEGFVLRLPLLPFTQTVTFEAPNGEMAPSILTIDPGKVKWQSRLNTLLGNATAKAMRNSELSRDDAIEVELIHGYVSQQGDEQYRGYLSYRTTDERKARASISLVLLDQHARPLEVSRVIVLGDNAAPLSRSPSLIQRNIAFAVKMPQGEDLAVMRIDSDVPGIETFFVLDEEVEKRAKDFTDAIALSAERDPRYEQWFKDKHSVTAQEAAAQHLTRWEDPVMFSVIAVGHDGADGLWDDALRSVLAQSYPHLELVIVPAGDASLPAQDILADERVRVVLPSASAKGKRTGDADLMNAGVSEVCGDFVCFMRACDRMQPDFLYCFACGLQEYPDAPLLYGDEGKLFEGRSMSPFFKPDWNPDLLTSFNYIGRLFAVRTSLLRALGPLRFEHDGAQEYRIALAAGRQPVAPYHARRIISQRVLSKELESELYAIEPMDEVAALAVLEEHFAQLSQSVQVELGDASDTFDVRFAVQGEPLVSLVIATKDSVPILRKCIDSILRKSTYQNIEVIIAENNSTDPETFAYYEEVTSSDSRVKLQVCQTGGKVDVSTVNNQGIAAASGEYVIILNNDVEVIAPDWIERMLGLCQRADVGAVGVKLLYPDGVVQHAGAMMYKASPNMLQFMGPYNIGGGSVLDDCPYYYSMYNVKQDLSACTSACLMTKK